MSNSFQYSELCYELLPTAVVMDSPLSHAGIDIILLLSSLHKSCGGGGVVKISTQDHWNPGPGTGCVTGRDSVLPPLYPSIAAITVYCKPTGVKQPAFSVSQFLWVKVLVEGASTGFFCLGSSGADQDVGRLDIFRGSGGRTPCLLRLLAEFSYLL